jgi:hypothetical protein
MSMHRGLNAIKHWTRGQSPLQRREVSDLELFFDNRTEGHGVWKWRHYFDVYDRHLRQFRGRPINILEIGIYSGGSLDMWADYFGADAKIYGADIAPECKAYEGAQVRVFIGDQGDRTFWKTVRSEVPHFDVVIDDGGHHPEQQIVTLEEIFPYMSPGGVFICEDVHRSFNPFTGYVVGLANELNSMSNRLKDRETPERPHVIAATPLQENVEAIHLYPFMAVLERRRDPMPELYSQRRGTIWQPFLDKYLRA